MAATNFNVYFYNFTKKVNSTRTPVIGTEGLLWEVHTCYLRSPSSIIAPVLEMSFNRNQYGGDGGVYNENIGEAVLEYNYAHIPRFNRYYFISNISWDNGMFILELKCDVLATYKEAIGNYECLIMRCADGDNPMLYDENKYVDGDSIKATTFYGDKTICEKNKYIYILGVSMGSLAATGGMTYIAGDGKNIARFIKEIMVPENWLKGDGTRLNDEELANLNPQAALKSVVAVPIKSAGDAVTTVFSFNGYTFAPTIGYSVVADPIAVSDTVSIVPPVAVVGNSYLNYPPFLEYTLYLPFVGAVSLSPYDLAKVANIQIQYEIDVINACITYAVRGSGEAGPILGIYTAQCGGGGGIGSTLSTGALANAAIRTADIQAWSGLATAGVGAAMIIAATFTGGATLPVALAVLSGFGAMAGGLTQTANAAATSIQAGAAQGANKTLALSSGGSRSINLGVPALVVTTKALTGGHSKTCGNPYCKKDLISKHRGYMMVKNASLDINGTCDEMTAVNRYLSTGFYYEEDVTSE
jgi:hypothetical protein